LALLVGNLAPQDYQLVVGTASGSGTPVVLGVLVGLSLGLLAAGSRGGGGGGGGGGGSSSVVNNGRLVISS
jgi:hypothetical protein